MFGLDGVLTTTFFSVETLAGQGLSSVWAIKLRRNKDLTNENHINRFLKTTNCVICLHKIRVDGTAGGVFRELVHDISG